MARKCHAAHRRIREMPPAAAAKMLNARRMTKPPPALAPPNRARKWPAAPRTPRMAQMVAAQVINVGSTTMVTIPRLETEPHRQRKAPARAGCGLFRARSSVVIRGRRRLVAVLGLANFFLQG